MNARVQQRKKFVYTALNDYNKASLIYTYIYLKGEYLVSLQIIFIYNTTGIIKP